MRKIKEDWACSIIGQAIADIRTEADAPRVMEKVGGTALGVRPDLMKQFRKLVSMKLKMMAKRKERA